jgi:ligand-binding SRPBCC domain-containing protein
MAPTHYQLERQQFFPYPREEVFAFFADAYNLEAITPDFLHFRILTPRPIMMQAGTLIDYTLRLFGIPLQWQTRIETFEPPHRFTDSQLHGPYSHWHHLHEFFEVPGGTLVRDHVDYALPFGLLGTVAHACLLRRTLDRIFDDRFTRLCQLFPPTELLPHTDTS